MHWDAFMVYRLKAVKSANRVLNWQHIGEDVLSDFLERNARVRFLE